MPKLIGYARVSTRQQSIDRQQADLLAAGVRRDDLYVDHGVVEGGDPAAQVARDLGMSRATFYRRSRALTS
ncbi:DNA invertase Pin-like site-specific DNA recombinase [Arthrobacter globiformis]|nr:recombinase family protein [Arthrobacter globiformis]MDQ0864952.1 DNA invertase Pin-like site-specific DNA recombinase [Arthrobacter globiformis]